MPTRFVPALAASIDRTFELVLRRGSNDGLPTYVGATGGLPASVTTDPALAGKLPVAIPETLGATEH